MKIYAISDLHLSTSCDKPMDIFGGNWEGYTEKIIENWTSKVTDDDLVLIAGDISWAMDIAEAKKDIWQAEIAPISPCALENFATYRYKLKGGEKIKETKELDKVYAGFLKIRAKGDLTVNINAFEREDRYFLLYAEFVGGGEYYGLELFSVGGFDIEITNNSGKIKLSAIW